LDRVEAENLNLAVVSDAGTPGISDPGFLIVRAAIARGIEVETLPGPTAFVPALISSGLPSDRFIFEGFLPVKKGRQTAIQRLLIETRTLILYESPHRLLRTLQDLALVLGEDRSVCVSREISKKFENHYRSTLAGAIAYYTEHQVKGEIVIVLAGSK
jgi:16S rRNA (cytidine1402-2'-O)-methyltransferase